MQIGLAKVDFETHQITGPKGAFSVEPKVMEVLAVLVKEADHVVAREDLIDQVWGVGYGGDERLSRAVSLLRKAFSDATGEDDYIKTIPKTGYKLTAQIHSPSDGEATATSTHTPAETPPKKARNMLMAVISAAIISLTVLFYVGANLLGASEPPLVMIMDSSHPARIYDERVIQDGGTNADTISDILADLPIRTQKELISPNWHRYEAITQFEPDLIVVHLSGFKQEDASGDRPQLRLLMEYFQNTDTEFLVYSRADEAWLTEKMETVFADFYAQHPDARARIQIFPLEEYGDPNWLDQSTSGALKLKIKDMLDIE